MQGSIIIQRAAKITGRAPPLRYNDHSLSNMEHYCGRGEEKRRESVLWCFVHVCFVQVTILNIVWRSWLADVPRWDHWYLLCDPRRCDNSRKVCAPRRVSLSGAWCLMSLAWTKQTWIKHHNTANNFKLFWIKPNWVPIAKIFEVSFHPAQQNIWIYNFLTQVNLTLFYEGEGHMWPSKLEPGSLDSFYLVHCCYVHVSFVQVTTSGAPDALTRLGARTSLLLSHLNGSQNKYQ